jgi:DNA-binding transcriptional regulator YdaS (Cro superfamily)
MDMTALDKAVEAAGSQLALASLLGIKPPSISGWYERKRVPAERCIAIELATGVSRHHLRPDVFGVSPVDGLAASNNASVVTEIRQLVDSRMSKRALRQKFGFKTDAHLAKVLGLPLEKVEGWGETDTIPALPQVMKLLGHEEQPAQQRRPQDPDADRIITLEVA